MDTVNKGNTGSKRVGKEQYYLDIADATMKRSTCLRRSYGAIIVKDDEIVSTGYNGAPRERRNCTDIGFCAREHLNVPHGERYELCRSVHAEANAIISASRRDMMGATMYLVGREVSTGELVTDTTPCHMCRRLIINAGVVQIVSLAGDGKIAVTHVRDWIFIDDSIPVIEELT